MLSGDLLLPCRLGERERYLWLAEDSLQVAEDRVLRLFERLAAHHHLAVGGAKVEHAAGLHHVESVDWLLEERALHDHLERVERLDAERRLRHHAERIDEQDVRWLDHVGREGDLRQFLRRHPIPFRRTVGVQGGLPRGGSLRTAGDGAALRTGRRDDQQCHAGGVQSPA